MPTINLKRKSVESLLGRKLSPLDIEKIPMLGVSLEFINNEEIVIETFINRPDYLSEQGFTRALSSFLGIKTGLKKYEAKKSDYLVVVDPSVNGIRPITLCAVVKNLKLDDEKIKEIIKMQEKLDISYCRNRKKASIGIYPLEKIKFPVHYKALHPQQIIFQPLEINQKLNANEILEKHPTGRKYSHLLHQYSQYPVFIDSNNNIMSLIPIINSHLTGRVTTSTKEVFIECSGYDINTVNTLLNIKIPFTEIGLPFREALKSAEGTRNTAYINAINLKVQQWASGASLTKQQIEQVAKLVPMTSDIDTKVREKLNNLVDIMQQQIKGSLQSEGIDYQPQKADLFAQNQTLADIFK